VRRAVDFILSIEECLQLHTPSPSFSQNKLLAKDAMLWRYCFCMTISQANHCTCHACVSIHICCQTHFVSVGSRGGRASMHAGGYDEEGKAINAVTRGKLGDLLPLSTDKCLRSAF